VTEIRIVPSPALTLPLPPGKVIVIPNVAVLLHKDKFNFNLIVVFL